jgi:crotonobetainyl-CoA:carnitine CoA-transferase CaiB-like acyl-CoA transferase
VQPLGGLLVVDLTRQLPGAYAGRELLRLGARVVRIESPEGDPMRLALPAAEAALNAGKESVVWDAKAEDPLGPALVGRADVVLEGFRPGVAERLGVGPDVAPAAVYCSITGFGHGPRAGQAGHDLNYMGYAGALADTAPSLPPVQAADLAAGALEAVTEILAALLVRERTGEGARLVVSMTDGAHRLVAHRLGGEPVPRLLTGGAACYGMYETADGRWLTVAALEPKFWRRLCAVVGRDDLVGRAFEPDLPELRETIRARPLADWLDVFAGEDVAAGPVLTLEEAAAELSTPVPHGHDRGLSPAGGASVPSGHDGGLSPAGSEASPAPALGEHTAAWRAELGL